MSLTPAKISTFTCEIQQIHWIKFGQPVSLSTLYGSNGIMHKTCSFSVQDKIVLCRVIWRCPVFLLNFTLFDKIYSNITKELLLCTCARWFKCVCCSRALFSVVPSPHTQWRHTCAIKCIIMLNGCLHEDKLVEETVVLINMPQQ